MGSPRLKKKVELNYRRGSTSKNCSHCKHFAAIDSTDTAGLPIRESRCKIIGLHQGRTYRINPDNICDAHDNREYLKRLRGY